MDTNLATISSYHSLRHIDGWWICTHSNTKSKGRLLEVVAKRLGLESLTVRVTE